MARRKSVLIMPALKDRGGDLTKNWYVEYSCRNPYTGDMERFRTYLKTKTTTEKRKEANKLIKELGEKLMSGWTPFEAPQIVYEDEIAYHNAAKTYGKAKDDLGSVKSHLSSFLAHKKLEVNSKSYQTYQSRLRNFYMYLELKKQDSIAVTLISNKIIIDFLKFQANRDNLSIATIKKYRQILYTFFQYLYDERAIHENPVYNIPRIGSSVDKTPMSIQEKDRKALGEIIKNEDPQLWLACMFMYYSAIRPGEELRNLRIMDLNLDSGIVTIPADIAKNDSRETVDMPNKLVQQLRLLNIDQYGKDLYVFGRNRVPGTQQLGMNTLRNRFNTIRDKYGFSNEYKFYSWKHTGAQALKDADVSPYVIQRHLRHRSFETTERYLRKRMGQNDKRIVEEFPEI